VNQCLTHGQGWNFLTFAPMDGTKNKRHLLFERAFNGSIVVGSGQCKSFNDMKPNRRRGPSPTKQTTQKTTAAIPTRSAAVVPTVVPAMVHAMVHAMVPVIVPTTIPTSDTSSTLTTSGYSLTALHLEPIWTTTPPPSPEDYHSSPTSLGRGDTASLSDTSMDSYTELHVRAPNAYYNLFESATMNPALLAVEAAPVEENERTLSDIGSG
jgi:hypothetical protein